MAMPTSSLNMGTDMGTNRSTRTQTATGMQTQSRTQTHGSATQTVTNTNSTPQDQESLVLRLRGAHDPTTHSSSSSLTEDTDTLSHGPRRRRHIQWDANIVDNEGLGRKKSKVCCIYHKPRAVGESSDESSSSSESDSDSASDFGGDTGAGAGASDSDSVMDGARPTKGTRKTRRRRNETNGNGQRRHPSPNAYEKMPRYDVKPLNEQPGGI